jgi:mannose-6-phosphate isomerase-like protein (cupin superfamily)
MKGMAMCKSIVRAGVILCGVVVAGLSLVQCGTSPKDVRKMIKPVSVQSFDKVKEVQYPWGSIRWLMSSELDGEAAQTFGIVQINAGQRNTLHSHPNCEELLYVLSGSCEHVVGDKKVVLHAGDLVRVPMGVPHQATVLGNEPLRAVISYSSGNRKVVNYGPTKE